ncbi:MAG: homoserine kinase [Snowella sp.]|nr:homoserine kinase [Snowella sp.]
MSPITVAVPATTANLGPGFDCLGAALSLYNHFTFTIQPDLEADFLITVTGAERDRVSRDDSNLLYQSFLKFYQHLGQTPPKTQMEIQLGVPLARGLGSSATAIIGGLVGANALAGQPLSVQELLDIAISIEGHPDNVAPALLGHCQLSVNDGEKWLVTPLVWHSDLVPVVAIPDFELSTEMARSVLPKDYARADAIFNVAHIALLVKAIAEGRGDWLRVAMEDKIHQPYRQSLIRGYEAVKTAAIQAGAYNLVISGAGPTLLAIAHPDQVAEVIKAIQTTWQQEGVNAEVSALQIDTQGAKITT